MELREINTPFITKRCITYNKDHSKALYRNRQLQLIKGCIYRGETQPDPYKDRCDIFAWFDGVPVAMWVGNVSVDYSVDEVIDNMQRQHCLTLKDYLNNIREKIQAPNHFMLTEMELIKHIAPELEESMKNARHAFYIQQKHKAEARRQQQEAEDHAFVAAQNEEAKKTVEEALEIIRKGGDLKNKDVTFYDSRYSHRTTSLVNHLMTQYGIDVPLRTKGWINDRLVIAIVEDGHCKTVRFMRAKGGQCSQKFFECMNALIQAVNQPTA